MTSRARQYPLQALIVYVALGVALGMIGWAVLLHDEDEPPETRTAPDSQPAEPRGR